MKKYINFSGVQWIPECGSSYVDVDINVSLKTKNEIMLEACRAIDEVRTVLLKSKESRNPVTLILPDNGVLAVTLVQAVRGLTGTIPFIKGMDTEEVDTESVREAVQESL